MIRAWLLYHDPIEDRYYLEERDGPSFESLDPVEWGLSSHHKIIMTMQSGQFLQAWVQGRTQRP